MADVFISYAREDKDKARMLANALEKQGWSVWWDPQIPAGRVFDDVIEEALDEAKCVVVLWSHRSIKSRWVKTEAGEGLDRDILVPVLIEDVKPPLAFRRVQSADLTVWSGDSSDRAFLRLVGSIKRITPPSESRNNTMEPSVEPVKKVKAPPQSLRQRKVASRDKDNKETIINEADGYELVKIPGGAFIMGSPEYEKGRLIEEGPQHEVQVPTFYLGRYPVTNAQYQRFLEANRKMAEPKYWDHHYFSQPQQPVVGVNWEDAQAYANWSGLRLPTEAEWEYACRAGTTTRFYTGDKDKDLDQAGWCNDVSEDRLHQVGEKVPNAFGLYDMHGNVWEWMEDDGHDSYEGAPNDGRMWLDSPRVTGRVIRGGGWDFPAWYSRSAARSGFDPGKRIFYLGFRLSRSNTFGP